MRNLAILVLFFSFMGKAWAQDNSIAKLKFEEAEEAYSKSDYQTAIVKLEGAEKLLKKTTPKILYLKILSRNDKIQSSDSYPLEEIAILKKNIEDYLKNYGSIDDKYREVFQIGEKYKYYNISSKDVDAANKGNVNAMLEVAKSYYDLGRYKQAMLWYEKAEQKGSAFAEYKIGVLHENGKGVNTDYKIAMQWYEKAASKDVLEAKLAIAWLYFSGKGVSADKSKALEIYNNCMPALTKKAEEGDTFSMEILSALYFEGAGLPRDMTKAFEWSLKAANEGSPKAMCEVALFYQVGYGVKKDYEKSFEWLTKSADKGFSPAMYYIGAAYYSGIGVKKDDAKALEWMGKSSDLGNAQAMEGQAAFYMMGLGTPADPAKGVSCFLKAANMGNMNAMVSLGNLYRDGTGVPVNYGKAKECYERAINETDDVAALRHLGFLYFEFDGYGNSIDYVKSVEYFNRAAAKGDGVSMKQLGKMYKNGIGVKKDKNLAKEWLARAETATIKE